MIIPYHSSGVNIVVICLLTEDSCACVFVDKLLGFPFCQADPLKTAGEETIEEWGELTRPKSSKKD